MTAAIDPVLQALTESALSATCATAGWLVQHDGASRLVVRAAAGSRADRIGRKVPMGTGLLGLVIESGQPTTMTATSSARDTDAGLNALYDQTPRSALCVPVSNENGAMGVLALVDSQNGSFTVDDLEIATVLATVAGAVPADPAAGTPSKLARDLEQLAQADPARYAAIATVVEGLLGQ